MTDTVKITLDLSKLSPDVRKCVPAHICEDIDTGTGELLKYNRPSFQKSALSGTKMKWNVRCGYDETAGRLNDVPIQIDAELNIPNAVVGQNIEHGTSVFAAGVAALELLRQWMAQEGLPREQLDLLSVEDVTLKGAWTGPAALSLMPHALAPVADLPVLEVVSATWLACCAAAAMLSSRWRMVSSCEAVFSASTRSN